MNTEQTLSIVSVGLADTERIASLIGSKLKGGEIIELISDLGGGKTAFVRGMAKGLGSKDVVGSPSFTISKEYAAGQLTIHHYDFYRLSEPGIIAQELAEVLSDDAAIIAIEWSDIVQDVLPLDRLSVTIEQAGDDHRKINLSAGPAHTRLLEAFV